MNYIEDTAIGDIALFLQGQRDCREGVKHESGKGRDYDQGYSYQYWKEQRQSNGYK